MVRNQPVFFFYIFGNFVADEEIGGYDGMKKFVQTKEFKGIILGNMDFKNMGLFIVTFCLSALGQQVL